jgi:hypothetical protein
VNFVNFTSGPHLPPPARILREIVNFVNFAVLARRRTLLFQPPCRRRRFGGVDAV